jgi:hypothetical protein
VSCQYFPCSFVLAALRELGLRLGVKAQIRAPRQLLWSPPRGWRSCRLAYSDFDQLALRATWPQIEIGTFVLLRSLHTRYRDPVWHTGMNRVDQVTRVLSDTASFVTRWSPALELLRARGYTSSRDPSRTESMFGPLSRETSLCESMFGVHKRAVSELRRWVLLFPITLSGDINSRVSHKRSWQGVSSHHALMIRST